MRRESLNALGIEVDIQMTDHIIFGDGKYFSFSKEQVGDL